MKHSCVQWVAKELAIVLRYPFDSDLQYNLRQGWRYVFNGDCDHYSWKKLNNWLQCWWSLRCCNQIVHVYQNCLGQSWEHVCDGAYDHYNYMGTRLKTQSMQQSVLWERLILLYNYKYSPKRSWFFFPKTWIVIAFFCNHWSEYSEKTPVLLLKQSNLPRTR